LHVNGFRANMAHWRFLDYHTEDDTNPFNQWYVLQGEEVQAAFDATLPILGEIETWDDPNYPVSAFKALTRNPRHVGLSELIFEVTINNRKRQYRAIGIWRKDQWDFILLTGFEKSGRSTNPPNAFEVAIRLRNQFNQGRGTLHEHV